MKATLLKIFALVLFAYTMSFAQQVKLVRDINSSGNNGSSEPQETVALGTLVVFRGYDPITGYELWVSNGSSAGTTLLKDISPGGASSYPYNITKTASNLAYFQAYTETTGYELWKTDGTTAGTVLVKDINPGTSDSYPTGFTSMNSIVYFPYLADCPAPLKHQLTGSRSTKF